MPYKDKDKQRQNWKEHYERNKEKYVLRAKLYKKQLSLYIRTIKESTSCTDCGKKYPYYVMDFDHINGDKEYNIANMFRNKGMQQVKKEIEKCEVVCSNCHRIRTHNRRSSNREDTTL